MKVVNSEAPNLLRRLIHQENMKYWNVEGYG
jgi:hypothetical protein